MSVPPGKVAFGAHLFPFTGLEGGSGDVHQLPVLPIRVRQADRSWSTPFNAVIDTGSTLTVLPAEVAADLGIRLLKQEHEARGAAGRFGVRAASAAIAVVDAHLPSVTCWELSDCTIWVTSGPAVLDFPVVGWDLLSVFEVSFNHNRQSIQLRYPPR